LKLVQSVCDAGAVLSIDIDEMSNLAVSQLIVSYDPNIGIEDALTQ